MKNTTYKTKSQVQEKILDTILTNNQEMNICALIKDFSVMLEKQKELFKHRIETS